MSGGVMLDMRDRAYRSGVLTVNLQLVGSALILALENIETGRIKFARVLLTDALADVRHVLDRVEAADKEIRARMLAPMEGCE